MTAQRWWRVVVAGLIVVSLVGAGLVVRSFLARHHAPVIARCQSSAGATSYPLDLDQAANAATISAVGKRLGLADHAVTIALAAALQESELRNLSHGDRDSLGLFQQRPSQGWGTSSQVMMPGYAAAAFYQHLAAVPGWETMAVTDAAQAVQRSAAPDAYAQWEAEARVLAQALTGEVPAGLNCTFDPASQVTAAGSMSAALAADFGPINLGAPVSAARGWTIAGWLIAHAAQYRVTAVAFAGKRWTPSGTWVADPTAASVVQVVTRPAGS